MAFKEIGSSFLSIFPANRDQQRAFASLRQLREQHNHIAVKLRASFATWAPLGRRASSGDARQHSHNESRAGAM
jgi:intracellular multiplication protein IcmB